jgi:hypothetical protein
VDLILCDGKALGVLAGVLLALYRVTVATLWRTELRVARVEARTLMESFNRSPGSGARGWAQNVTGGREKWMELGHI